MAYFMSKNEKIEQDILVHVIQRPRQIGRHPESPLRITNRVDESYTPSEITAEHGVIENDFSDASTTIIALKVAGSRSKSHRLQSFFGGGEIVEKIRFFDSNDIHWTTRERSIFCVSRPFSRRKQKGAPMDSRWASTSRSNTTFAALTIKLTYSTAALALPCFWMKFSSISMKTSTWKEYFSFWTQRSAAYGSDAGEGIR